MPQDAENNGQGGFPPKPMVADKSQHALRRSVISIFVYGLLFYFFFDRNVSYIAAILLVIIVHEMGHFAMMKLFGYRNVKIFIVPLLGAFTKGEQQQVSQWRLALVILAGPLPGIIIGTALLMLFGNSESTLSMLTKAFLVINLLNCLPIFPLDGGRLLETLFFRENHILRLVFGILSIMALLLLFLFLLSPVLLIIPALIGLELYNENKHQKIRDYLKQEGINYKTSYEDLPDKDYWLIRDCLLFSFPRKYRGVEPGRHEYALLEGVIVQQISSVLQANLKEDMRIWQKLLVLAAFAAIAVAPVYLLYTAR